MNGTRARSHIEARFRPELASVVAARRLIERTAAEWGLGATEREDLALLTSELVTNSVLHARSEITVRVQRLGSGARLEVADENSRLPVIDLDRTQEPLRVHSMTGRGLAVVAALSDRWGADPVVEGGKVVWAEVGTGRRRPTPVGSSASGALDSGRITRAEMQTRTPGSAVSGRARTTSMATEPGRVGSAHIDQRGTRTATATKGGRRIRFIGVPVRILVESLRQYADLQREMSVMAMDADNPELADGPAAFGPDVSVALDAFRRTGSEAAYAAMARGDDLVDFDVVVTDEQMALYAAMADRLQAIAGTARSGRLLTMPPGDEVRAYRRWYKEEVERQLEGRAPRPYPGSD